MSEMMDDVKNLMSSDNYGEYVLKDAMDGCKKEILTQRKDYTETKEWLQSGGDEFMAVMNDLMCTKRILEEQHKDNVEKDKTESMQMDSGKGEKLSICFTGKLDKFTRDEARAMAQDAGYLIEDGVTKSLTILVAANPDSNSGKMQKARKFGTEIISQEEFLSRMGNELVNKHLKKKEEKESADVTWEKLLKKVCRKIGASCEIKNEHGVILDPEFDINDVNFSIFGVKDYRSDSWCVNVNGKSGRNIFGFGFRRPAFESREAACEDALNSLFKMKDEKDKHGREDDYRDLPSIGEFKTPNQVKLALEIMGWRDMF